MPASIPPPDDRTALARLAADSRFKVRRLAVAQRGDRWIARVRCGVSDGPCPVWQAEGATRDDAIEAAARQALGFWESTAVAGAMKQDWR